MTRKEAKDLFRNDKDSYGKPRAVMTKIDEIYDDFESEQGKLQRENELFQQWAKSKPMWDAEDDPNKVNEELRDWSKDLPDVFSRDECVFMYCPHPEHCQDKCIQT